MCEKDADREPVRSLAMRSLIVIWLVLGGCMSEQKPPPVAPGSSSASSDSDNDEPPQRKSVDVKAAPVVVPKEAEQPAPSDPGVFGGGGSTGGCTKGCRCGNSCISCAKTCHK